MEWLLFLLSFYTFWSAFVVLNIAESPAFNYNLFVVFGA